jgi:hypothetical protein
VDGDAVLNNRKAKLIPSYELEIKGGWEQESTGGGASSGEGGVRGAWTIPYLADENAGEDPDLTASVPPGGDAAAFRLVLVAIAIAMLALLLSEWVGRSVARRIAGA